MKVLIAAPYLIPVVERFRPVLAHYGLDIIVPTITERMDEEQLLSYAGQFDAALSGDDRYTRRVLEACSPRLKVISKWGTGIDSIDRRAAEELGIRVCNTPNAFTLPVADSVMGYILTFARRLTWMDASMKRGAWEKLPGRALCECTLGIIGIGNVGKAILRRARVFGMRLLGNDIVEIAPDFIHENRVEMLPLDLLLRQADFVSVNCDLNPSSTHLINAETLAWMKPTGVLINTARGPIVDETALIQALQVGRIGGAALDVFEVEPLPQDSPLLKMENVLLAPHNSNSSPLAWERAHWNTIHNALNGLGIAADDLDEVRARTK